MSLSLYLYISLYVYITPHARNKRIVKQVEPPHTRPPTVMNKLRDEQTAHVRAHVPHLRRVCLQICTLLSKTPV